MKLGASINLFDCEELLKPQLINLRPLVDHISVIWQRISYQGQECSPFLLDLLHQLKGERLIDDIIEYKNIPAHIGQRNEISKRSRSLQVARERRCTHFITLDADEFYDAEQFINAKNRIIHEGFNSSACSIQDYYKSPEFQINGLQHYFVPFIYAIPVKAGFNTGSNLPNTLVDPTRRLRADKFIRFESNELVMHHMTTVRASYGNLLKKFNNSSAKGHWGADPSPTALRIWNYKLGDEQTNSSHPNVVKVEDKFNIQKYLDEYACKYL